MFRTSLALVILATIATPLLLAQPPRAKPSGATIIEPALDLLLEMLKATDAAYQRKVLEEELAHLELQLKDINIRLLQAIQTQERAAAEIKLLNKVVDDRQKMIARLEGDVKKHLVQSIAAEARARVLQLQVEKLLEERRGNGGRIPHDADLRDPNRANPPEFLVNGKIERVDDKDNTLMQISLGNDHGVNKNHTLEVYRLAPEPKYLGTIRIVEAYQLKSVARLIFSDAANRPQLKVGDKVTSKHAK